VSERTGIRANKRVGTGATELSSQWETYYMATIKTKASKPEKISVILPATKPRNPLVAPTLHKKAGKHAPSPGGERKRANDAAKKEAVAIKK
jgi:hypothetical protein